MRTVAIIQCRLDSQRLPGKALLPIGDRTILGWVVHRTRQVPGVDEIVVATSDRITDEPIVEHCRKLHVDCMTGDAEDVLDRFLHASLWVGWTEKTILRVTADCPLLDPVLNGRVVETLNSTYAEYVGVDTRSNGFAQEAFTWEALDRAWVGALPGYDREHVVPWMIRNLPTLFIKPEIDLGAGRFCVDTEFDLQRLRKLYEQDSGLFDLPAERILELEAA